MAQRELVVRILGDDKDLQRAFKSSAKSAAVYETRIDKLSRGALAGSGAFGGFGRSIAFASTAFLGGAGFTAAVTESVKAASNLNEQTSKSRVIFKASSREVEKWAKTTSQGFGIAEDKALEAAGTLGGLFTTVGLGARQASVLSRSLVELAADLGSISNIPVEDALLALRSGLAGEAEPLRRFNVFLSEARVQQEAFAATGKKSARELTNLEKVQARYSIILKDSAAAQGDFARTQEGFANQTKTLQAEVRNLSADLGKILLPVLTDIVSELNEGTTAARKFGDQLSEIPGAERLSAAGAGAGFKDFFKAGFIPGIVLVEELGNKVKFLQGQLRALKGEVAAPFDFSAINALTQGITRMSDALAAKDRIESQLEAERIRPARGPNITAEQRNQFFDAKIARQINRVQDASLREQVAQLEAIADRIRDKIKVTEDITRLNTLADDLLDVNRQRKAVLREIADNAKAAAEDAKAAAEEAKRTLEAAGQALIDGLQFGLTKAQVTASFKDDLAALNAINAGLRQRIKVEGETLDLQRQLFENQQQIAATNLSQQNARQFFTLGLSPTGGERTPGLKSLRRQLGSFEEAVEGTFLDTTKTESVISKIRKVLGTGMTKVSDEVRAVIKGMLDDLNQQLKDHKAPLTKGSGLNVASVLAGLGLSREETQALRSRLSHVSSTGQVLASRGGLPAPLAPTAAGRQGLDVHTTLILDGAVVARSVTRNAQTSARRVGTQTTGPHAGNASGTNR